MLNYALYRVEEIQDKKEEIKKIYDFKHTLASWVGAS